MTNRGRRWTVSDREGNPIFMTEERWAHITGSLNHPEVSQCEEQLKTTLRRSRRQQEPLNPRQYRYQSTFDDLPDEMTHVVAIVRFGDDVNAEGETVPNNFVATAFLKHQYVQGGRE